MPSKQQAEMASKQADEQATHANTQAAEHFKLVPRAFNYQRVIFPLWWMAESEQSDINQPALIQFASGNVSRKML